MCQFKVPPVMGSIIDELGLTPSTAGLTMSVFAITGIVLAFPAVTILRRLRPKMSGVIALVLCVIGSFFEDNAALEAASQWEETIAFMVCAAALGIVLAYFSKNNRLRRNA